MAKKTKELASGIVSPRNDNDKPACARRWTKKQLRFMQMLADPLLEKKDEDIAAELNVKPETLLKWRRLPGFQKMAKKLAEEYLGNGWPAALKGLSQKAKEGNVQAIKLLEDYIERYGESSQKEHDEQFDIGALTEEERRELQSAVISRIEALKGLSGEASGTG